MNTVAWRHNMASSVPGTTFTVRRNGVYKLQLNYYLRNNAAIVLLTSWNSRDSGFILCLKFRCSYSYVSPTKYNPH